MSCLDKFPPGHDEVEHGLGFVFPNSLPTPSLIVRAEMSCFDHPPL